MQQFSLRPRYLTEGARQSPHWNVSSQHATHLRQSSFAYVGLHYGIRKDLSKSDHMPEPPRIGLGNVVQSEKYFYEQRAEACTAFLGEPGKAREWAPWPPTCNGPNRGAGWGRGLGRFNAPCRSSQ